MNGPGAGKSTLAADIFAELKWEGINAELVTEYAKDKVWEESFKVFKSQIYIFGKQYHREKRLTDVDVIVTDSPLMLSILYNSDLGPTFDQLVYEVFNQFNNLNYFVERTKPYNPKGRFQTEKEAKIKDQEIFDILNKYNIPFTNIRGEKSTTEIVAKLVLDKLNK